MAKGATRLQRRIHLVMAAAALAALAPVAQAAEQVVLTNGFEMRCDHHAQDGARVRLYLNAGEDSFIELSRNDIASMQQVADKPDAMIDNAKKAPADDANLGPADLRQMLAEASRSHNLDVDLLASVVKAESDGNAHAVSRAGAQGLMQLMPSTAAKMGVEDSFAPRQNVRGGSAYLDELLRRYHENLALALAAYNAGPEAVDRCHGIPPYRETRAYVARVIHEFNRRVRAREAQARHEASAQSGRGSSAGNP